MSNQETTSSANNNSNPKIIRSEAWSEYKPQTVIRIFVDTASVSANAGTSVINKGVYMIDNRGNLGSAGQGGLDPNTHVRLRDFVGFYIDPIDTTLGDIVSIEGFQVLSGDIFGSDGFPIKVENVHPNFWVGQVINNSNSTYRIKCKLVTGGLRARTIYFQWDPHFTVVV
ncbi:hypothetical protein BHU62_21205 [Serratia marcescens]|uniref:Inclusion body protein n=1 Tax=Serratia marcescens TaxID=615 RepID=A0A1Q4NV19_SERMA|nr:hypothetical protein [Serratia marcescens]OKB64735.1 hypothetical protein BHU62_21205 [Serratia marcescens]